MNKTASLKKTFNQEAINQNIKPVADFFRMHGDETAETYSNVLLGLMEVVLNDELNYPSRSNEQISDLMYHLKELNKLVISLKDPVKWSADFVE